MNEIEPYKHGENAERWHEQRRKAILQKNPRMRTLYGYSKVTFPVCIALTAFNVWSIQYILHSNSLLEAGSLYICAIFSYSWLWNIPWHEGSHGLFAPNQQLADTYLFLIGIFLSRGGNWLYYRCHVIGHHRNTYSSLDVESKSSQHRHTTNSLLYNFLNLCVLAPMQTFANTNLFNIYSRLSYFYEVDKLPLCAEITHYAILTTLMYCCGFKFVVLYKLLDFFMNVPFINPLGAYAPMIHYTVYDHVPALSVRNPLFNIIVGFVGYHVEHHDFPKVCWYLYPMIYFQNKSFYKNIQTMSIYSFWKKLLSNQLHYENKAIWDYKGINSYKEYYKIKVLSR